VSTKLPKPRIIPNPTEFYTKCNRIGEKVIIVKGVCLYVNKSPICQGCKYNIQKVDEQKC
jgi:hypothetical protein